MRSAIEHNCLFYSKKKKDLCLCDLKFWVLNVTMSEWWQRCWSTDEWMRGPKLLWLCSYSHLLLAVLSTEALCSTGCRNTQRKRGDIGVLFSKLIRNDLERKAEKV